MSLRKKLIDTIGIVHPEWELGSRKDDNKSIQAPDSKVFAYLTTEFGGVTINARLYKTDSELIKFSGLYCQSSREYKIGRWKDEVIDIRLENENEITNYIKILEVAHNRRKKKPLKATKVTNKSQLHTLLPLKSQDFIKVTSLN
ncbi:MAG: hypothetical protein H7263_05700 [Candidatus Sericytochromatia bacterium]|nr:hypothetical protein [Candidatus Sericytochromatia bacterium]